MPDDGSAQSTGAVNPDAGSEPTEPQHQVDPQKLADQIAGAVTAKTRPLKQANSELSDKLETALSKIEEQSSIIASLSELKDKLDDKGRKISAAEQEKQELMGRIEALEKRNKAQETAIQQAERERKEATRKEEIKRFYKQVAGDAANEQWAEVAFNTLTHLVKEDGAGFYMEFDDSTGGKERLPLMQGLERYLNADGNMLKPAAVSTGSGNRPGDPDAPTTSEEMLTEDEYYQRAFGG